MMAESIGEGFINDPRVRMPPIGASMASPVEKIPYHVTHTLNDIEIEQPPELERIKSELKRVDKIFEGHKIDNKTLIFYFDSDDIVDPDSIRIELEIANPNKYNYLQMDSTPHSLIKSTKWIYKDKILENINDYNVLMSLLNDITYKQGTYFDNYEPAKRKKEDDMPLTYGTREELLHPRIYGTEFIFNNQIVQTSYLKKHEIIDGKIDLRPKTQQIYRIPLMSFLFCNGPDRKGRLLDLGQFRGLQLIIELNEFAFFVPCFNATISELVGVSDKDDIAYESYYNFMSDFNAIQKLSMYEEDLYGYIDLVEKSHKEKEDRENAMLIDNMADFFGKHDPNNFDGKTIKKSEKTVVQKLFDAAQHGDFDRNLYDVYMKIGEATEKMRMKYITLTSLDVCFLGVSKLYRMHYRQDLATKRVNFYEDLFASMAGTRLLLEFLTYNFLQELMRKKIQADMDDTTMTTAKEVKSEIDVGSFSIFPEYLDFIGNPEKRDIMRTLYDYSSQDEDVERPEYKLLDATVYGTYCDYNLFFKAVSAKMIMNKLMKKFGVNPAGNKLKPTHFYNLSVIDPASLNDFFDLNMDLDKPLNDIRDNVLGIFFHYEDMHDPAKETDWRKKFPMTTITFLPGIFLPNDALNIFQNQGALQGVAEIFGSQSRLINGFTINIPGYLFYFFDKTKPLMWGNIIVDEFFDIYYYQRRGGESLFICLTSDKIIRVNPVYEKDQNNGLKKDVITKGVCLYEMLEYIGTGEDLTFRSTREMDKDFVNELVKVDFQSKDIVYMMVNAAKDSRFPLFLYAILSYVPYIKRDGYSVSNYIAESAQFANTIESRMFIAGRNAAHFAPMLKGTIKRIIDQKYRFESANNFTKRKQCKDEYCRLNEIKNRYNIVVSREYDLVSYFCYYTSFRLRNGKAIEGVEPWSGTTKYYKLIEKREFDTFPPDRILFSLPKNNVRNIFQMILSKAYKKYPTVRMLSRYNRKVKNYWVETEFGTYPKLINKVENTSYSENNFVFEQLKDCLDLSVTNLNRYNTAMDDNTQMYITKKLNNRTSTLFQFAEYANHMDNFFFGYFTEINSKCLFGINIPKVKRELGIEGQNLKEFYICCETDLIYEPQFKETFANFETYTYIEGEISYEFDRRGNILTKEVIS